MPEINRDNVDSSIMQSQEDQTKTFDNRADLDYQSCADKPKSPKINVEDSREKGFSNRPSTTTYARGRAADGTDMIKVNIDFTNYQSK